MPKHVMATESLWVATTRSPAYPKLERDVRVDAVVIGGGITGITAAYLLKQAGRTVAVVERGRCGHGETGHTTAHLTAVPDLSLADLVDDIGADHAQAVWDAGFAAISRIRALVRDERINCQFAWVQGCLHAAADADLDHARHTMRRESDVAESLGIDATYVDEVAGVGRPGVMFDSQARFHPLSYLEVLASRIPGDGSYIFEDTSVDEIGEGTPARVRAGQHAITADYVVVATHSPHSTGAFLRDVLLQTDLYAYSTYAMRGLVRSTEIAEGLYWEMREGPYEYLRVDRRDDHYEMIFGGGDHKTGQAEDTSEILAAVDARFRERIPGIDITHRWSGQVLETRDGLPYIGEISRGRFAATGFAGNGMTFGTLAGMMAADAALGRSNPWRDLFDIKRTSLVSGAWDYLRENKDYPYYLIRDRFTGVEGKSLRAVPRGHGRIVRIEGQDVAAYRDEDGNVTAVSPVCTHLGCRVAWNNAERTWDCPCHGSRFQPNGAVLAGPAETPLEPISVPSLSGTPQKS